MRAEVVVDIARSPEEVFAYLTDVGNLPVWQSGVHSAELDGELHAGARIQESRTMLGRELSTTLEIEEYVPSQLFTLRALDGPIAFSVRHELEPSGSGTRLTVTGEGGAARLPGFAAGIMVHRVERQFRTDFERLKRLLEG